MLPFLLAIILSVCILTAVRLETQVAVMLIFNLVLPLICLVVSVAYGINNSFNVLYVVFVTILIFLILLIRIPLVWEYAIFYGAAALVGNVIGMILNKRNIRIKGLEKYGRYFTVTVAISVAGSYIITVVISAIMMSQMTQIVYTSYDLGLPGRSDIIIFSESTAIRIYRHDPDMSVEKEMNRTEIFGLRFVCSIALFPLWQDSYNNPRTVCGDMYFIVRTYRDSESEIFGSNSYPLTYWLFKLAIEGTLK